MAKLAHVIRPVARPSFKVLRAANEGIPDGEGCGRPALRKSWLGEAAVQTTKMGTDGDEV